MATSRADRIAEILDKRRPMAKNVGDLLERVATLDQALGDLGVLRDRLTQAAPADVAGRLLDLNVAELRRRLGEVVEPLKKLQARFDRGTLNIGVVGRARQGKSRLLQSLSGLGDAEIPSGDREHCTGTRSVLEHSDVSDAHADVYCYRERQFLDGVLRPYFSKLHLGQPPRSLDEFAASPLPEVNFSSPALSQQRSRLGAMYDHLRTYHSKYPSYRGLLRDEAHPRRIPRERIREFVAQDTVDGRREYASYLAVEQVRIRCRFPHGDVGRIAFIDMPGLGDTGVGDEERLIETLGREVDFVLFVRKPSPDGDYLAEHDHDLYDTAFNALSDLLPLGMWSFMVLNRVKASQIPPRKDNAPNCGDLARSIEENQRIRVARCVTADCSDPAEVKDRVLDQLLDYLAGHIESLDDQFAAGCREQLAAAQQEVLRQLAAAAGALASRSFAPASEQALVVRKFNQFWMDLTQKLQALLRELRELRNHKAPRLGRAIKDAIRTCREEIRVPGLPEIQSRADGEGGLAKAYNTLLNQFRADVGRHFLLLDSELARWVEEVKSRVAGCLKATPLGELSDADGGAFLDAVRGHFTPDADQLARGFASLCDFRLSYRLLIQYRIRKHLDLLDLDSGKAPHLTGTPTPDQVRFHLENQIGEVLYLIEPELERFMQEPSEAAFAVVEEFVDRVLRADGAQDEWRLLMNELRSDVWKEDFTALGEQTRRRRQWEEAVARVRTLCPAAPSDAGT